MSLPLSSWTLITLFLGLFVQAAVATKFALTVWSWWRRRRFRRGRWEPYGHAYYIEWLGQKDVLAEVAWRRWPSASEIKITEIGGHAYVVQPVAGDPP